MTRNRQDGEDQMQLEIRDPLHADAQAMLDRLSSTLLRVANASGEDTFDYRHVRQPRSVFFVAYASKRPIGCAALRPISSSIAELKRMYAEFGRGSHLLLGMENAAKDLRYRELWLSTRVINTRAVNFYLKHGYRKIPNYGKYVGRTESICFAKPLNGSVHSTHVAQSIVDFQEEEQRLSDKAISVESAGSARACIQK